MISDDISDAYLQEPQKWYAAVSLGGTWYRLEYTLPGQRAGSSDWFEHLPLNLKPLNVYTLNFQTLLENAGSLNSLAQKQAVLLLDNELIGCLYRFLKSLQGLL